MSSSVGHFFSSVWPRLKFGLSSIAPALGLTALTVIVLVYSVRLQIRHKQMLNCGRVGYFLGTVAGHSSESNYHRYTRKNQNKLQPDAVRLADAKRECVELKHLMPTAVAIALTRLLHLSVVLFYTHDPFAVVISGPVSSRALSEQTGDSSSAQLERARILSLALLSSQIATLAVHAAALPFAALFCSSKMRFGLLCFTRCWRKRSRRFEVI